MARARVRAATRKLAERQAAKHFDEADQVAVGVRAVCKQIAPMVVAGSLYWTGPVQYVAEQMAVRVCAQYRLPPERHGDVAGYLLAAINEYIVGVVGGFDVEHFEAWTAAAAVTQ